MNKQLHISYFAMLREQRGLASEEVVSAAVTARDLFAELAGRHGFSLSTDRLRVAVNGEFATWDAPLFPGAKVAFIPPVAGG